MINRDHDLHTKRNDVRAGRSLWVQMLHKSANVGHGISPAIRTTHFGHSKSKKLSQLEYILHLFLKIIISAYYNYLQVSHFLVKLEPVFLLLPPWQVKPNWWAAPTVGPTIGNNHWQQPLATTIGNNHWQQPLATTIGNNHWQQPLAISESVLLKIIISIWPRGHIFN